MLKIKTLYANLPQDQKYVEDIYDTLEDAQKEHSDQLIVTGYCIIDTTTNWLHPGSEEWYNTYDDVQNALHKLENDIEEKPELYALQPCNNGNIVRHVRIKALDTTSKDELKDCVSKMLDFYCEDHNLSVKWRKNITWDDAIDIAIRYPRLCHDFGFEVILEDDENKINLNEPVSN